MWREAAPRKQRDSYDAEVIAFDAARLNIRLFAYGQLLPFNQEIVRQPIAAHRKFADKRRLRARQRIDLLEQRATILRLRGNFTVASFRQVDAHGQQIVGIEARIDATQPPETVDQQSRAHE